MLPDTEPKSKISFREFIEKTTNLLTVFAVFNALTIYAASLPYKPYSLFLAAIFLLLSLLVCYELVMFTIESKDDSFKYELFYFLISSAQLLMIFFFIRTYALLVAIASGFGVFALYVLILSKLLVKPFVNLFVSMFGKVKAKKYYKGFTLVAVNIIMLISMPLTILTIRIATPYVTKIIPKDSIDLFIEPDTEKDKK